MRRKVKLFAKPRDETEDVVQIIQALDANNQPSIRPTVIKQLMAIKNINEDTAKANIDCALCLGVIVLIYNGDDEPVLKDVAQFKKQRLLVLKQSMDLSEVVLQTLNEMNARSIAMCRPLSDIEAHILLTYDLKTQNVDGLTALIQKATRLLFCRNSISSNPDVEDVTPCYFIPNNSNKMELNGHQNNVHETCFPSTSSFQSDSFDNCLTSAENSMNKSRSRSDVCAPPKKKKMRHSVIDEDQHFLDLSHTKGELKQLQDSLSQFFTPSNVRRSRLTSLNSNIESTGRHSKDLIIENSDTSKPTHKGLEIVIDEPSLKGFGPVTSSSDGSLRSPRSNTTPSPHRRHDQLQDALSTYFKVNNVRRKRHEKGEYFLMNSGSIQRRKLDSIEVGDLVVTVQNLKAESIKKEEYVFKPAETVDNILDTELPRTSSPPSRPLRTPRSQTSSENRKLNLRNSSSLGAGRKDTRRSLAEEKANQLLKRACDRAIVRQNSISNINDSLNTKSPRKSIISPYKSKSNAKRQIEPASFTRVNKNSSSTVNNSITSLLKSPHVSPFKASRFSDSFSHESPWVIPEEDCQMFDNAREIAQKKLFESSVAVVHDPETQAYPARIRINNFEIDSWYSSPYPQEYIGLPVLYVCESCLTYLADEYPHVKKCKARFPPGNEIYRNNNISIFEVDGNLARVYCRNLCLLAKLFIDHKTLYFDVEPFLFYVMTLNDDKGAHFVGYFSKEKFSHQKYNLACIITLPCYQGKGFGRFLIDFSYLLSRRENMLGTPERPLSELGQIAYYSYWKSAIFEELYSAFVIGSVKSISLNDISQKTGIFVHDVLESLTVNGMLKAINSTIHLVINIPLLKKNWNCAKNNKSRIWMNESKLQWTPKSYTPSKEFLIRSPVVSPVRKKGPEKYLEDELNENTNKKIFPKKNGITRRILDVQTNSCNLSAIDEEFTNSSATFSSPRRKSGNRKLVRGRKVCINSRELTAEEADLLSEDEDDDTEFLPRGKKTMSCKNDTVKKDVRNKTPSSDEDTTYRNSHIANSNRTSSRRASYSTVKSTKSRRFSKSNNKRNRKTRAETTSSPDSSCVSIEKSNYAKKVKSINQIYSSSEDNKSLDSGDEDSTSEYEEPKRKNSSQQRGKKINSDKGLGSSKSGKPAAGKKGEKKGNGVILKAKKSSSNVQKNMESSLLVETTFNKSSVNDNDDNKTADDKPYNKSAEPSNSRNISNQKLKNNWKNSDSSDFSDSEANSTDDNINKKLNENITSFNKKETSKSSKSGKKYLRSFYDHRTHCQLYQHQSSEEDEHDEACSSSSMSPQPLGDRLPILNALKNEPETINMGGEPDTVNMGGEPDDLSLNVVENVFSPKAPLAPPANVEPNADDDEITQEVLLKDNERTDNVDGTTSNVMLHDYNSQLHKSFNEISSHKNFNNSLNYQNHEQQDLNEMQGISSQSFNMDSMYENYLCSSSISNTNLNINSFMCNVKNSDNSVNAIPNVQSQLGSHPTYYPQQPCIDSHSNSTHSIDSRTLDNAEEQMISDKASQLSTAVNDRNSSDMPVLDSGFHREISISKEPEEDDDDAPPQLSPNFFLQPSADIQPPSLSNEFKTIDKCSILPVLETSTSGVKKILDSSSSDTINQEETSMNNTSITNVSYESVRSSGSQKHSQTQALVNLLNDEGMPTLPAQDGAPIRQNSSEAYNYNQRLIEGFQLAPADYSSTIDSSLQLYSSPSSIIPAAEVQSATTSLGVTNQSNAITSATSYDLNYEQQMFSSTLNISESSKCLTSAVHVVKSPNSSLSSKIVSSTGKVISPQAQLNINVSSHLHLHPAQQQLSSCTSNFLQENEERTVSKAKRKNKNVIESNQLLNYPSMNSINYLSSTMTAQEQQNRLIVSDPVNKKGKKLPKEKPVKTTKRSKTNENRRSQTTAPTKATPVLPFPPTLPFMGSAMPFMHDCMPHVQAAVVAQFAAANNVNQEEFAVAAAAGAAVAAGGYYVPASYLNASAASANVNNYSQLHYPPMVTNPFYSNPAWSNYYSGYPTSGYPELNRNGNLQLPISTASSSDGIVQTNPSSAVRNEVMIPPISAWPMPMMNSTFPNNAVSAAGANDSGALLNAAAASNAATAAAAAAAANLGVVPFYPQPYGNHQHQHQHQNLQQHQPYYSAHT